MILHKESRTFRLQRDSDVTGVSGDGIVADGVVFPDGATVIRWRGKYQSTVVWPSIEDAMMIHGHNGSTRILWDTNKKQVWHEGLVAGWQESSEGYNAEYSADSPGHFLKVPDVPNPYQREDEA